MSLLVTSTRPELAAYSSQILRFTQGLPGLAIRLLAMPPRHIVSFLSPVAQHRRRASRAERARR
jgi:hypothetical protein